MTSLSGVCAASREDIVAFVEVVPGLALGTGWSREGLEKELELSQSRVMVIRDLESEEPVALMVYWVLADGLELLNMYTRESYRRRGLARSMMEHLLETSKTHAVAVVFLDVRASNQAALGLYLSMGFKEVGRRKGYYDSGAEDALLMRWEPLAELGSDG